MEPQNTSSSRQSAVLNANFTNTVTNFPAQFTTDLNVNATTSSSTITNTSSPFFMSKLQQLSNLSNNSFFQANSQINSQFGLTNFTNWNTQSNWLDQAKMAAMLPMYIQTTPSTTNNIEHYSQSQNSITTVEENLKNQVANVFNFSNVSNTFEKDYNKINTDSKKVLVSNDQNYYNSINESFLYNCNQTSNKKITHPQKFHYLSSQSQYNNTVQSPISNTRNHSGLVNNSPLNNGTQLVYGMHQSSYPSSSSSHPPSNEEMVDSPLSTYSSINLQSHQIEPTVSHDLCSNSPYNYQNSFVQQQFSSLNSTNNLPITKKNFAVDLQKQTNNSSNVYCNQQLPKKENLYKDLSQQQNLPEKHTKNNLVKLIKPFIEKTCNAEDIDQKITIKNNNIQVNDNVEDFSVLDLRDFEEFLNDKEVLSATLGLDTGTLFCSNNGVLNTNNEINNLSPSTNTNSSKILTENNNTTKSLLNNNNSNTLVTSIKLREKIHELRAEELANADKELDRLVSLVARQNDAKTENNLKNIKPSNVLPSMYHFDFLNCLKPSTKIENASSTNSLNPVQFTPPDSPTNTESSFPYTEQLNVTRDFSVATSLASSLLASLKKPTETSSLNDNFSLNVNKEQIKKLTTPSELLPTTSVKIKNENCLTSENSNNSLKPNCSNEEKQSKNETFVFIPKTDKFSSNNLKFKKGDCLNIKYNRVPIYKQQSHNSMLLTENLNLSIFTKNVSQKNLLNSKTSPKHSIKTIKTETNSDAYSFTDDEDNEDKSLFLKNLPSSTTVVSLNNTKNKNSNNVLKSPINTQNLIDNSSDSCKRRKNLLNLLDQSNSQIVENTVKTFNNEDFSTKVFTITNQAQRKRVEKNSFIQIELANENDVIETELTNYHCNYSKNVQNNLRKSKPIYFCRIKDENDDVLDDHLKNTKTNKSLPKLVIKSIKPEHEQYDLIFDDKTEYDKDLKKRSKSKKKRKKKEKEYDWIEGIEFSDNDEHRLKKHKKHKKHKKEKLKQHITESSITFNDKETFLFFDKSENIDSQSICSKSNIDCFVKKNYNDCDDYSDIKCKNSFALNQKNTSELTAKKFLKETRYKMMQNFQNKHIVYILNSFGTATSNLPKGTFLVAKEDVFKNECPLWKIDNQNLLQKYLPILTDDKPLIIRYKNSSTYSGWCDKIVDNFLVLSIKYIKQSRAENIVEPLIPISELFPAISKILNELKNNAILIQDHEIKKDVDLNVFNNKIEWQKNFQLFIKSLLKDAINFNFFQLIKFNDTNYSLSIKKIQQETTEIKIKLLKHAKWSSSFQKALDYFVYALINEEDIPSDLCQACKKNESFAVIQFFQSDSYNDLKFNDFINCENEFFAALPAIEFMVCKACKHLAKLYHKIHHIKCHIFKICDLKLEDIGFNVKFTSVNDLIEQCINDKIWLQSIINEYAVLWNECTKFLNKNFNN